jgi:hypothetical protein
MQKHLIEWTSEPRLNRLIQLFPPDECILIIKLEDTYVLCKPWLDNLLSNPYICSEWALQEMQDLIEIEDVNLVKSLASEYGFGWSIQRYTLAGEPLFYEPSQN